MTEQELAILTVVRSVPPGTVATYGQIAKLAGYPKNARQVGSVMKKLPPHSDVPWHRIVNSQGRISERSESRVQAENYQRDLLISEGIEFTPDGKINLKTFRWRPDASR